MGKEQFNIAMEIFNRTLGSQIKNVKFEDIPNVISNLLSKALNQKVEVQGNGLTSDLGCFLGRNNKR